MTTLLNKKTKPLPKKEGKVIKRSYQEVLEKLEKEASLVGEEPPAWHEAVLKEREKEWEQRGALSRSVEEVFKDLKAKARGN